MATDLGSLLDTARRLIKSECRLHILREVDQESSPFDLEQSLCNQLWQQWRLCLQEKAPDSSALRGELFRIKQEALTELAVTLEGIDLSQFDENFSIDLLLSGEPS
jgi:hypothetical protein